MNDLELNLEALHGELDWLQEVIIHVLRGHLKQEGHENQGCWCKIARPALTDNPSVYGQIVRDWDLNKFERLALALTLAPHLRPEMLDVFFGHNQAFARGYTEFGGVSDKNFSGFLPTGQTLNFLATSQEPVKRGDVMNVLSPESRLMREQALDLAAVESGIPSWSGLLSMPELFLQYLITGEEMRPELSSAFPANRITTKLDWGDLVLEHHVMEQVEEINTWLLHGRTLMDDWQLGKTLKPGYRALFYGPPGTGKTLTAGLLGKASNRDVFRVDLSMVVSKYIGETEKNLSKVFDAGAYKDWILFFDEADALFGKRTAASTSNDRHANQQTGYLLQRIEDFPGVVILASNLKSNMDEAFTRRFQAMIHFTMPSPPERYELWKNAFSGSCGLHPEVNLEQIAEDYELSGGAIINVLRYSALSAVRRKDNQVNQRELMAGLAREFKKDNRTLKSR